MKDFENKNIQDNKTALEISIQKEQKYKLTLDSSIIPHENHTLFEIDNTSQEIIEATYEKRNYIFNAKWTKNSKFNSHSDVIIKSNKTYVSALNKKSALSKFLKGNNGTRIDTNKKYLDL